MSADAAILENIARIEAQITAAAEKAGRSRHEIALLPVTKTIEPARIITALNAGYKAIGENKVQEITAKETALAAQQPQIHLIGHLQSNKVKYIVGKIHCLQTLDSIKLAEKLQARLEFADSTITALIQVHTAHENSKTGIAAADVPALLSAVQQMPRIQLRGFMTVSTNTDDKAEIRRCFRMLKSIQDKAQQQIGYALPELSMGMSGDMDIAIEEGSTLLRIGSAIFGARNYNN